MIYFHYEDTLFRPRKVAALKNWLKGVAGKEGFRIGELNYIFCSDPYLLEINKNYLNHNYLTDIITFDNREHSQKIIEGDIFMSIDRVKENAVSFDQSFTREFKRVMVHGLLHLTGYKDKTPKDQRLMREKEDEYLNLADRLIK